MESRLVFRNASAHKPEATQLVHLFETSLTYCGVGPGRLLRESGMSVQRQASRRVSTRQAKGPAPRCCIYEKVYLVKAGKRPSVDVPKSAQRPGYYASVKEPPRSWRTDFPSYEIGVETAPGASKVAWAWAAPESTGNRKFAQRNLKGTTQNGDCHGSPQPGKLLRSNIKGKKRRLTPDS